MKVLLKKDWDLNINSPVENKESGHFAGRNQEQLLVSNEIERKSKGSILISGYRGVGKTSLVYKSLRNIKSRTQIIIINAAQLDPETEGKNENSNHIHPKRIIENIIRRLYSSSTDSSIPGHIKSDIERLYQKTTANTFSYKLSDEKENIQKEFVDIVKEYSIKANVQDALYLLGFLIGISITCLTLDSNNTFYRFLSIFLIGPTPFLINSIIKYTDKSGSSRNQSIKRNAVELYNFDNCIGNLV